MSTPTVDPVTPASLWSSEKAWEKTKTDGLAKIAIAGGICSASSVLSTVVPVLSPLLLICSTVSTIAIPIIHIWSSRHLLKPAYKYLSPSRRLFVRWLSRMAFANLTLYVYMPSIVWISVLTCPLGFLIFTRVQQEYIAWQMYRETHKLPLHTVEYILLWGFGIITITIFTIAIVAAAALGYGIQVFFEWMGWM